MSTKWARPANDVSFRTPIGELMPTMDEIPAEFQRDKNAYVELTSKWFFEGLKTATLKERPGICRPDAFQHLGTVLQDFQPSHEHKTAAVAYLMSLWFEIDLDGPNRVEREKKGLPPKKAPKRRKSPKVSRRFSSMNYG